MAANTLKIQQHWDEHPAEAESIRGQLRQLTSQLESLNAQKVTIREKTKWLHAKMESKETEMKGFSLFSAERKAAKAELKELKKQYEAQNTADFEREKQLINSIKETEKQIKELKISNPGVLGEVETITPSNAPNCQAIRPC